MKDLRRPRLRDSGFLRLREGLPGQVAIRDYKILPLIAGQNDAQPTLREQI